VQKNTTRRAQSGKSRSASVGPQQHQA